MIVAIIRSVIFNVASFSLTMLMGVGAFSVRWFARGYALPYAKLWSRLVLALFQSVCGVKVHIVGRENLPAEGPLLIASQHQSAFDTLIWMLLVSRPCYVMKGELRKIPLVGPMLILAGMMPINRSAGTRALRVLLQETSKAMDVGKQVIIFPEGTRTAPGERVPLKPGITAMANHTKQPVIPVATNSGVFWGRNAFLKKSGDLYVVIGKPVQPAPGKVMISDIQQAWRDMEETFSP
nr:lysophospholipid acyltransferase family protein [Acetobacter sp. DsW_059]